MLGHAVDDSSSRYVDFRVADPWTSKVGTLHSARAADGDG